MFLEDREFLKFLNGLPTNGAHTVSPSFEAVCIPLEKLHPIGMGNQKIQAFGLSQLNWVRTGSERAETVVLIHAVGYDLTYWDRQIGVLQTDYNVVAFDLPGDRSSLGEVENWSFDFAAATVANLIEYVSNHPVHFIRISAA